MKIYTKPATSKLVINFDNQLKEMLMEDLKAFVAKGKLFSDNIQALNRQNLSVA